MRALTISISLLFFYNLSVAQLAELSLSLSDSAFFISKVRGTDYSQPGQVLNISEFEPGNCFIEVSKLKTVGQSTIQQPVFNGNIFIEAGMRNHYVINYANQSVLVKTEALARDKGNAQNMMASGGIPINTQAKTDVLGMSNFKFNEQLELLRNIDQERQRYITARDLLSLGTLKSSQIAEMMLLFPSEANRVRIADEGQQFATDPENYQVVFEALSRRSAVRRLSRRLSN